MEVGTNSKLYQTMSREKNLFYLLFSGIMHNTFLKTKRPGISQFDLCPFEIFHVKIVSAL